MAERGFRRCAAAILSLAVLLWGSPPGASALAPYGDAAHKVGDQYERYPYLCVLTESAGITASPEGCCAGIGWTCPGSGESPATDWRNIVLMVSDDQAYCQYGFMAGVCSRRHPTTDDWVSCTAETDCKRGGCVVFDGDTVCATDVLTKDCTDPEAGCTACDPETGWTDCTVDLGSCVATADLGTCAGTGDPDDSCAHDGECASEETCDKGEPPEDPDPPFRLNELTCRNRQPKSPGNDYCSSNLDALHLSYDRSQAPCENTPIEARPVLHTPNLDELAETGVVFPRAYVAGIRCKNSRRAMMHGRYQRHLQYLFEDGGSGQKECPRETADFGYRGRGCKQKASQEAPECDTCDECSDDLCEDAYALGLWTNSALATSTGASPGMASACVDEECEDTGDACSDDDDCRGPYVSLAFAKTENMAPGQGGFDKRLSNSSKLLGLSTCDRRGVDTEECLDSIEPTDGALHFGEKPLPAFGTPHLETFFDFNDHLARVTQAIDGYTTLPDDEFGPVMVPLTSPQTASTPWAQRRPFFMWFGIHTPHTNTTAPEIFRHLYDPDPGDPTDPYDPEEFAHYARVSWLDWIFGGLRYHLQRSCVCGADGTLESLEDNTVYIWLSDHGYLPDESKGNLTEDGLRTPLIVSTPEDRASTTLSPDDRVFWDEVPNAIDLLPTILEYSASGRSSEDRAYFSTTQALQVDYPHGRGIRTWISELRGTGSVDERRFLTFGEEGTSTAQGNNTVESGFPRHLVTSPGLLGVCDEEFEDVGKHAHPCLSDADCNQHDPSLGTCNCPPGSPSCTGTATSGNWGRCVNFPRWRCDEDSDCAAPLCLSGKCASPGVFAPHAYADFANKACTDHVQCVPPGACHPLTLKIKSLQVDGGDVPTLDEVYDVESDPTDNRNILEVVGSEYMSPDMTTPLGLMFRRCLAHLSRIEDLSGDNALDNWHDNPGDQTIGCPESWGLVNHLRPNDVPSGTWWTTLSSS